MEQYAKNVGKEAWNARATFAKQSQKCGSCKQDLGRKVIGEGQEGVKKVTSRPLLRQAKGASGMPNSYNFPDNKKENWRNEARKTAVLRGDCLHGAR